VQYTIHGFTGFFLKVASNELQIARLTPTSSALFHKNGLFGARITGGGSGGTVAVIGRRDAADAITNLAERYAEETGHQPYVFRGSSPGSAAFWFF